MRRPPFLSCLRRHQALLVAPLEVPTVLGVRFLVQPLCCGRAAELASCLLVLLSGGCSLTACSAQDPPPMQKEREPGWIRPFSGAAQRCPWQPPWLVVSLWWPRDAVPLTPWSPPSACQSPLAWAAPPACSSASLWGAPSDAAASDSAASLLSSWLQSRPAVTERQAGAAWLTCPTARAA